MTAPATQALPTAGARTDTRRWILYHGTRAPVLIASTATFAAIVIGAWNVARDTGLNDGLEVTSALFVGVLLAHAAAGTLGSWLGYRERRLGLDVLAASAGTTVNRARVVAIGGPAGTMMLAVVLAGVAAEAAMLVAPYRDGNVNFAVVLGAAAMVSVTCLVSYFATLAVPRLLMVPACGLFAFLVPSAFASGQGTPLSMLVPSAGLGGSVFLTWNNVTVWAQLGWFAGTTALLLALAAATSRSPRLLGAFAGTAALVMAASALALASQDWVRMEPAVNGEPIPGEECSGDVIALCLPPAYEGMREELATAFAELMDDLEGTPGEATTLELRPRGIGGAPADGATAIHLDSAREGDAALAREEYIESLLDLDSCYEPDNAAAEPWETLVYLWLTDDIDNDISDSFIEYAEPSELASAQTWFSELDDDQRNAWMREHYDDYVTCELAAADFGETAS